MWEISIILKSTSYIRYIGIKILLIVVVLSFMHPMLFMILSFNKWGWYTLVPQLPFRCMQQVMYMYLCLPKDPCDAGTPVAPEEKNIVDMPAVDFSLFFPVWKSFHVFLCALESCFAEKCQQQSSGLAIISSTGIINQADIPRMVWHKTNIVSPAACAHL